MISRNIKEIVRHYLIAALWTEELDNRSIDEINYKSIQDAFRDVREFVRQAGDLLDGLSQEQIGHDFWLTRNHHGTGFWDRNEIDEEVGKKLTAICHEFGSKNVFGQGDEILIESRKSRRKKLKESEVHNCYVCSPPLSDGEKNLCVSCETEGYWIDTTGGLHFQNDSEDFEYTPEEPEELAKFQDYFPESKRTKSIKKILEAIESGVETTEKSHLIKDALSKVGLKGKSELTKLNTSTWGVDYYDVQGFVSVSVLAKLERRTGASIGVKPTGKNKFTFIFSFDTI